MKYTDSTYWIKDNNKVTLSDIEKEIRRQNKGKKYIVEINKIKDKCILKEEVLNEEDRIRVSRANTNYPIIIAREKNKIKYIMDGHHRVRKMIEEGRQGKIEVKVIDLDKCTGVIKMVWTEEGPGSKVRQTEVEGDSVWKEVERSTGLGKVKD